MRRMERFVPHCLYRLVMVLTLAVAPPAWADPSEVVVRTGDHPGFGRVVFEASGAAHPHLNYDLTRDGGRVTLHFPDAPTIGSVRTLPRNVLRFTVGPGGAELVVASGARLRPSRIGERVVIDVLDPAAPTATVVPATVVAVDPIVPILVADTKIFRRLPIPPVPPLVVPSQAIPSAGQAPAVEATPGVLREAAPPVPAAPDASPVVAAQLAQLAPPHSPGDAASAPAAAPVAQPAAEPERAAPAATQAELNAGPVDLAASLLTLPPGRVGAAFSVPFGAAVGAAALRRGDQALIVFDERRPIDMAGLAADKLLAAATVQMLPSATIIRLPLPTGMEASLSRSPSGSWAILLSPLAERRESIAAIPVRSAKGRMVLSAAPVGNVVSIADPETGAVLLVGTLRQPGVGVPVGRRAAQFILLPSWQGIAVQPLTDQLSVRPTETGFVLAGEDTGAGADPTLSLASVATESGFAVDAAALTRRFDFPAARNEELLRRMQVQLSDAAAAPPLARGEKRVAAAQTAIALGLGTEAQSMLAIAAQEDPSVADSADVAGLSAVAALLAGRMDATDGIEDPRLSGSDEVALWRAVRAASLHDGSPEAAAMFAATLPLVLAYPAALRDRLLPQALETMALGGEAEAAKPTLREHKDDPALQIATGLQRRATGDIEGALAAFDAAAEGQDRHDRARAALLAVELRLAAHRIEPKEAAARLEAGLYGWRGDGLEFDTRLRLAGLKADTGDWRSALGLLRETATVFPERKLEVQARLRETFDAVLREPPGRELAPLDLVALVDENTDLLAQGTPSAGLQAKLADRLLALDLPKRAGPLLEKLLQSNAPGASRAGFGATLARLRLQEGNAEAAIAALYASSAEDLPAALSEQRMLLFAQASARRGDSAGALAALAGLDTPAADEARATVYEQTKNWPAATAALAAYASRSIGAGETLDEPQTRTLMRLATAASQAGDEAILATLRGNALARTGRGPLADLFRLLTAVPITDTVDLKRSRQEMAMARSLPAGLKALEGRPAPP